MPRMIILLTVMMFLVGCSGLMGNLRRDLDDSQPYDYSTSGGVYPEGNLINEGDLYKGQNSVGHLERSPAGYMPDNGSWVDRRNAEANRRDYYRNFEESAPSYSQKPNLPPEVKRLYKKGDRATKEDFIDDSQNEGSLWASDGQTNYYFTKNRIKNVGDIITVTVEDQLVKDVSTEVKKSLSQAEMESEIMKAQKKINQDSADKQKKQAGARAPAGEKKEEEEEVEPRPATYQDIDLTESVGIKSGEGMMAEVIERYANGNYKIRGTKRVPYAGGMRMMTLVGIARAADLKDGDLIPSGKLYEYRVKVFR